MEQSLDRLMEVHKVKIHKGKTKKTKYDIYEDIVRYLAEKGEENGTSLLTKIGVSSSSKSYLEFALEFGLVSFHPSIELHTNSLGTYRITEKGLHFLRTMDQVHRLLSPTG